MVKQSKKEERAFERRDRKSDEEMIRLHEARVIGQNEERAFRRMAQSMGFRLPGADIRRKQEMK